MATCGRCGTDLEDEPNFCPSCGEAVSDTDAVESGSGEAEDEPEWDDRSDSTSSGATSTDPGGPTTASGSSDDGIGRRTLIGGAALLGLGWFVFVRDTSASPEEIVREFVSAANAEDTRRLRELAHSEGPYAEGLTDVDDPSNDDRTLVLESIDSVERDGSRATVTTTVSVQDSNIFDQTLTMTFELRTEDGNWRIWSVDVAFSA